ncbi:MAG TPA: GreA/GreB family elongation factor [Anaeromyxobacteraceae bacterium]|nr:GreA/GreB family elongation factor [Anaeromyxobacteraceae bacterium]
MNVFNEEEVAMQETISMQEAVQDVAVIVGKRQLMRLQTVVERHRSGPDAPAAERLDEVLRRAIVVPQQLVPPNIVAIGSTVRCEDLETGTRWDVILTAPEDADDARGRVSILEPLSTALLGAAEGDAVEWTTSDGRTRRTRITSVARMLGREEPAPAAASGT